MHMQSVRCRYSLLKGLSKCTWLKACHDPLALKKLRRYAISHLHWQSLSDIVKYGLGLKSKFTRSCVWPVLFQWPFCFVAMQHMLVSRLDCE